MKDREKLMLIEGALDDMDINDGCKLDAIQAIVDEDMAWYEKIMWEEE